MGRVRIAGTARASFAVRNQEVRIEAADGLHNDGGWSMKRWVEETFHANWRVGMEAEKILYEDKTEHQHIIVFENAAWGTVLIIDGVFQLTTLDEFIYHEMMAHVPLMALERPRRVLIIGGGDGGVLREVLKHPSVEKATLCEIDRTVIDLAQKYFPQVSSGAFDNPRADIVIGDGLKYVAETTEQFDAIIVDSSEPIGPSAVLHTEEFFGNCKRALKPGGILVTQNGLPFLCADMFASTTRILTSLFKRCAPYIFTQPCYFGGEYAINWGSDEPAHLEIPAAKLARRQKSRKIETRYWTPELHVAAFALPAYALKVVEEAKAEAASRGRKTKQKAKAAT